MFRGATLLDGLAQTYILCISHRGLKRAMVQSTPVMKGDDAMFTSAVRAALVFGLMVAFHGFASAQSQTKYTYDAAGRVSRVEYSSGASAYFKHDQNDNRNRVLQTSNDLTLNGMNWSDLSFELISYGGVTQGLVYAETPAQTVSGLTQGASVNLEFIGADSWSSGAGMLVKVYKNNSDVGPAISIPDALGQTPAASSSIPIQNGDSIHFRLYVSDTSLPPNSGLSSSVSARVFIVNAATGDQLDAIDFSGMHSELIGLPGGGDCGTGLNPDC